MPATLQCTNMFQPDRSVAMAMRSRTEPARLVANDTHEPWTLVARVQSRLLRKSLNGAAVRLYCMSTAKREFEVSIEWPDANGYSLQCLKIPDLITL